jgi:nucleoside-diphosphate kinase
MKERTLSIIKPDGVEKGVIGKVITRLEEAEFKIVAMKIVRMSRSQAAEFYAEHEGRPYFEGLTEFMASGPWVVMVLEAEDVIKRYRLLMGTTNSPEAAEGTIRREFGTDGRRNVVHGSDSPETAAREISYFFDPSELIEAGQSSEGMAHGGRREG